MARSTLISVQCMALRALIAVYRSVYSPPAAIRINTLHRRRFATIRSYSAGSTNEAHKDANANRLCWRCQAPLTAPSKLHCEKTLCGAVQPVHQNASYFDVFGLKESFDVPLREMHSTFINLQKKVHPDGFAGRSNVFILEHCLLRLRSKLTFRPNSD